MTQCVTLCMTQNMGATLLKIGVYDTKMYDTKCKTIYNNHSCLFLWKHFCSDGHCAANVDSFMLSAQDDSKKLGC